AERRSGGVAHCSGCEEIRELVDEGVFIADLQARHPPVLHIRMVPVCHMNAAPPTRSEEHTSELQSRFDLVCRLLLEKKKFNSIRYTHAGVERQQRGRSVLSGRTPTVIARILRRNRRMRLKDNVCLSRERKAIGFRSF